MSSISADALRSLLDEIPDDYRVVMKITTKSDIKAGTSLAYINGFERDDEFREIRLMN